MRTIAAILLLACLSACNGDTPEAIDERTADTTATSQGTSAPQATQEEFHPNSPFKDLPLRYDGHYREQIDNLLYLIRFFPEGIAVLVNGTSEVEAQLPPMLRRDALGDPNMGYYNVPVTVEGDSIFFITRPERGELSYRGMAPDSSRVVFLRHSHITGVRNLKEYLFVPDGPASE